MKKIIRIHPEADDFLSELPFILCQEGYKSTYEAAYALVGEIIDFIQDLNNAPSYPVPKQFAYHFKQYGDNLNYAFFKRKSSRTTTWYVFFLQTETQILVTHISNNWIEGQYIR